jgi:hypothetical protein
MYAGGLPHGFRRVTTKSAARRREEVLREWCEAATAKAREASGRQDLAWKQSGEGIYRYHCPNPDGGHQWKGDDQTAWVRVGKDGRIEAGCRVCAPKGSEQEAAYTETMKDLLGWEDEDKASSSGFVFIRSHDYDTCDGRFTVRRIKYRGKHGNSRSDWMTHVKDNSLRGLFARFKRLGLKELREAEYPSLANTYHMVHFYQHQRFRQHDGSLTDFYSAVVVEGEKDAETFNAIMSVANHALIATTLPHQTITSLAPHHVEVLKDKRVILIGDNDKGGQAFVEHWSAAVWGIASAVKVFPREVFGEGRIEKGVNKGAPVGRDFTEWVEVERGTGRSDREIADEIAGILTRTEKLLEPLAQPKAWKQKLRTNQKGGISASNLLNGKIVWTEHPMLAGRLWLNILTAQIEVHDPPWEPGTVTVGAKRAASLCSIWLDEESEVMLSASTLEDSASACADKRNPHEDLISEPWDGVPRMDGLFTNYIPLNVNQVAAAALSRVFMGDLAAKAQGELVPQRAIIGIGTDEPLDLARALAGEAGGVHRGVVREALGFTRSGVLLVQTNMEPIADKRVAWASFPALFGPSVWHERQHLHVPSPAFIAAGVMPSDPRTAGTIDERCFALALAGKPMMEQLANDAPQLFAEAVVRLEELKAQPVPSRESVTTLDAEIELRNYELVYQTVEQFSTLALPMNRPVGYDYLTDASPRQEPLDHVIRDQWMLVMGPMLAQQWRTRGEIISVFNAAMKAAGLRNTVSLTPRILERLGWRYGGKSEKPVVAGAYLGREHRDRLLSALTLAECRPYETRVNDEKPREPAGCSGIMEALEDSKRKRNGIPESNSFLPRARAGYKVESISSEEEEEAEKIIHPLEIKITDGLHVEAVREDGSWLLLVKGVEVDPIALTSALADWPSWEDPPRLVTTVGQALRAWLAEVGIEAVVEEVA